LITLDIDRAREINDARRIDEAYEDDGLNSSQRLLKKFELNADETIELFISEALFAGTAKQEQNASSNWFAENLWELMYHHANNDNAKFERDSSQFMRHVIIKMESSV
jgi:hypothetical protein